MVRGRSCHTPAPGAGREEAAMPLYEYRCGKCGHITEVLEKADSSAQHVCEKCGGRRMEKLISSFGVGPAGKPSGGSCPTGTCPLS